MSEQYSGQQPKNRRLTYSAVAAVVGCLAIGAVYGHIQSTERENAAENRQQLSLSKCVSAGSFVRVAECAAKALQPQYETSKDYYDLKAQQDMAKWALLMLFVTGVGVYYVARTLKESENATEAALIAANVATQELEDARLRARPSLSLDRSFFVITRAETQSIVLTLNLVNVGSTPAVECSTRYVGGIFECAQHCVNGDERPKFTRDRPKSVKARQSPRHILAGGSEAHVFEFYIPNLVPTLENFDKAWGGQDFTRHFHYFDARYVVSWKRIDGTPDKTIFTVRMPLMGSVQFNEERPVNIFEDWPHSDFPTEELDQAD